MDELAKTREDLERLKLALKVGGLVYKNSGGNGKDVSWTPIF